MRTARLPGLWREAPAVQVIYAKVPPPSTEVRRRALDVAIADALAHGVTSVQDFSAWEDWLVLETMERTGKLDLRFSEWAGLQPAGGGAEGEAGFASGGRSTAAPGHAEGVYGWLAGVADGGSRGALHG